MSVTMLRKKIMMKGGKQPQSVSRGVVWCIIQWGKI